MKRLLGTVTGLCGALALTACSTANFNIPGAQSDAAQYGSLYADYLEYCAFSSIQQKPGLGVTIVGGIGGHAAFYLNGACRVPGQGYPVLGLCDHTPGGGTGVGVTMDGNFINATWVATPGRKFFFNGGLQPGERMTPAAYLRVQQDAKQLGLLDGVRFDPAVLADKPAGMSQQTYEYDISIGTDYAVGLARSRYCARVPLSHAQIGRIVDELNAINGRYRYGPETYQAGVFQDNCVHLPHNALAAVDFWRDWPIDAFLLFALVDFPVPKNDFVNVMRRANDMPLANPLSMYRDAAARRELLTYGRLPTEPGALAYSQPIWQANDVYDTNVDLLFFDDPVIGDYRPWFKAIFSNPRYFDLQANRAYFDALYQRIEADRKPVEWWLSRPGLVPRRERQDFQNFYSRYYDYIHAQRMKG